MQNDPHAVSADPTALPARISTRRMMAMSGTPPPMGLATVITNQAPFARPWKLKRLFASQVVRRTKAE